MAILLEPLISSWSRSIRARTDSTETHKTYLTAARQLDQFLLAQADCPEPEHIKRAHVEAFLQHLRELGRLPSTISNRFRGLQQFFAWAEEEDEIVPNPMAKIKPPIVPLTPVPLIEGDQLTRLLKACSGKTFIDRRDEAIVRLLLDTGGRRAEIAGLQVSDVNLDLGVARVIGKGNKERGLPFGKKTEQALDRYIRKRKSMPAAHLPQLWLNEHGQRAFGYWGIGQMLDRRAVLAGLGKLNPHMFRHTFSHEFLADGGQENDLMIINGWTSPAMLQRYGASGASQRARAAGRKHSLGDRL